MSWLTNKQNYKNKDILETHLTGLEDCTFILVFPGEDICI